MVQNSENRWSVSALNPFDDITTFEKFEASDDTIGYRVVDGVLFTRDMKGFVN